VCAGVSPADEPALRYAGYFGTSTLACLTGEVPRVSGGQRIGRGAVGDDAEHDGDGDDGGGVVGSGTSQLLQGKEAEHHRRQAAGTEPAHQGYRVPVKPCPDKGDRYWRHPDHREAKGCVQYDLPVQDLHRRCHRDCAERQPDQQRYQGAGFLNERHQGLAASAACRAEREPADERGDEPVAVQRHRGCVGAHRQAQHR